MLLSAFRPEGLLPPRRTVRAKQAQQEIEALEEGELDEEEAARG
jgi:branched-chain amino acid transport system permease protein